MTIALRSEFHYFPRMNLARVSALAVLGALLMSVACSDDAPDDATETCRTQPGTWTLTADWCECGPHVVSDGTGCAPSDVAGGQRLLLPRRKPVRMSPGRPVRRVHPWRFMRMRRGDRRNPGRRVLLECNRHRARSRRNQWSMLPEEGWTLFLWMRVPFVLVNLQRRRRARRQMHGRVDPRMRSGRNERSALSLRCGCGLAAVN